VSQHLFSSTSSLSLSLSLSAGHQLSISDVFLEHSPLILLILKFLEKDSKAQLQKISLKKEYSEEQNHELACYW